MKLFSERHRAPSWLVILGIGVTVVSVVGLFVSLPSIPARNGADASALVAVLGIGIAIGVVTATQTLSVVVQDRILIARLTPFVRRAIQTREIASVAPVTINPAAYGGFGFRRAAGRPPALFQRGGSAAEIALHDGSVLLVECDDVASLAAAVRRSEQSSDQ